MCSQARLCDLCGPCGAGCLCKKAVAVAQTSRRHRMLSLCFDVCGLLFMAAKTDEPTGGIWLFYYSKFWEKRARFLSSTPFPHSHSLHVFLGRNVCQWKHVEGTLCPSAHGLWFSDASFGWYGFRNMEKKNIHLITAQQTLVQSLSLRHFCLITTTV